MYRIFLQGQLPGVESFDITDKPVELLDLLGTVLRDVDGDIAAAGSFGKSLVWTGVSMQLNGTSTTWEIEVPCISMDLDTREWTSFTRIYRAVPVGN